MQVVLRSGFAIALQLTARHADSGPAIEGPSRCLRQVLVVWRHDPGELIAFDPGHAFGLEGN
jgi:hypothetical protein